MSQPNNEPNRDMFRPYTPQYAPDYHVPSYYKLPLRQPANRRDMVFAGIFLLLSLLCVNFALFGGAGMALSLAAICMYATGVIYLYPKRRCSGGYAWACMLLYVLCALSLCISHSGVGKFLSLNAMLLLSSLTVMELMSLRRQTPGTIHATLDWLRSFLILPFGSLKDVSYAIFHKEGGEGAAPRKRKMGPVLLGIACALPVLLVVVPLLTSADAAFSNLLRKLTHEGGPEPLITLLLGCGLFLLYFGQHFSARYKEQEERPREDTRRPLDTAILTGFLSVICLIYVLYLFSQLAYFFNAFAGLLPEEFTVAEYARQGFFEMVAVCVINLLIMMFALLKAKKDRGKEPVILRIFSLFLCVFSLVLIATAISKMVLYIDRFGMTYLRLLTSVFMVFLCVLFLTMILWLFLRKIPYMKVAVITAALLIACVGFANPDRVVASYNVKAYLAGDLKTVDMDTMWILDRESVVPYVWQLRNDGDESIRKAAPANVLRKDFLLLRGSVSLFRFQGKQRFDGSNVPGELLLRTAFAQMVIRDTEIDAGNIIFGDFFFSRNRSSFCRCVLLFLCF